MGPDDRSTIQFTGRNSSLVFGVGGGVPTVLYWGARLEQADACLLSDVLLRTPAQGTASIEVPISTCPTLASGFVGTPGLEVHRSGHAWDANPTKFEVVSQSATGAVLRGADQTHQIAMTLYIEWCAETDMVRLCHSLENNGQSPLYVNKCCAATIQLPDYVQQVTSFDGKWAMEFQASRQDLGTGAYVRENLRGRTSHASFPGILLHAKDASEQAGAVFGFHLGWSGNHQLVSERLSDGRTLVQLSERLLPGECRMEEGQYYETPWVYGTFSNSGFSGLSQNFHSYVRNRLLRESVREKPRPVHYNTWEAVYFDHNPERLKILADKAASLGAERFILDDGWFSKRRGDAAGLGDWFVDTEVYPAGLAPLVSHVNKLGMEFGLWVEPEMVNPDSDLYRSHPDWVLAADGTTQIPYRNQLVLDLTRDEVREYLFERLDSLLAELNIRYLKWDMNRDINHPGSKGRASIHDQTRALYELLGKLRLRHPGVEIESCSSGGARADYGVLAHADRIWTSDSNDALDRLEIQRGASVFLPSDVMGAHVGPRVCHITGRTLSMELRTATAFFGHMGMEMDLEELTAEEEKVLRQAIALHKKHRSLIHDGNLVRLDGAVHAAAFGIVAADKSEALFSYTQTSTRRDTSPEVLRLAGLDPKMQYGLDVIWPLTNKGIQLDKLDHLKGRSFSGELLMNAGLQLPPMWPEAALIFQLEAGRSG